ncbi:ANTAR domain-containing response regulator [Paenirhodobacter populi]|uniref:ANTAR domain-containing protein n=1 Tax=Paenirhodobacter populi TaxID=2306993 RepID=A0A443JIX0_9RHOB|nr:ANTAR domain-containing protein [Sinirhodobacter populi]RWR09555.1 ANTAR domain-containing protein [Sinirhodobacter populi]RWR10313.1 ANTAR domain-containing protein [Sinirhodobacter populi]RWR20460.1 ANTAR domain-containing protein [Sinirhodobacter populi]
MKRRVRSQNLGGARAILLHRPHPTVQALERQLAAIGLAVEQCWPDLPASAIAADFIFFDADHGHDSQFPWEPGNPPMPMIALIGSEAPGRIEWALNAGADAQLLKPVGDGGAFSALLTARAAFEARQALAAEVAALRQRLDQRQTVVRAVAMLMGLGKTEDEAYAQLRAMAMAWRISFEGAAERVVAAQRGPDTQVRGGRDD